MIYAYKFPTISNPTPLTQRRLWITIVGLSESHSSLGTSYYKVVVFFSTLTPLSFLFHSNKKIFCTVTLRFDWMSLKLITEFLAEKVSKITKRLIIWIQPSFRGLNMHIDVPYYRKKLTLASSAHNSMCVCALYRALLWCSALSCCPNVLVALADRQMIKCLFTHLCFSRAILPLCSVLTD